MGEGEEGGVGAECGGGGGERNADGTLGEDAVGAYVEASFDKEILSNSRVGLYVKRACLQ